MLSLASSSGGSSGSATSPTPDADKTDMIQTVRASLDLVSRLLSAGLLFCTAFFFGGKLPSCTATSCLAPHSKGFTILSPH